MVFETSLNIVRDTEPLMNEFLPELLTARTNHVNDLVDCIYPLHKNTKPLHAWIHGPSGSGKSSVVKKALGQLEEMRIRTALVNCWTSQTFYSVLESIFQELKCLVGEKRETSYKFERLRRIAKDNPLIIVLDEVDQMFMKEGNATLYNLAMLGQAGIVCLSQTRESYVQLDPRVSSRLQTVFFDFPPYSQEQICMILQERAEHGLESDSWCKKDLENIANASNGDARKAIQTLRIAAYLAEKKRKASIELEDIEEGLRKSNKLRKRYILKSLSDHHKLLYQIVKEAGKINSVRLWKKYMSRSKEVGVETMARRTYNHYKQQLIMNKLIEERQGKGRANKRLLKVVE